MPTANDFQTILVRTVLFTPGLQFRSAKILGHLLTEYGEQFDGEPNTGTHFPIPPGLKGQAMIKGEPQVTLQNEGGTLRLDATPSRLDVIKRGDAIGEADISAHLAWASDVGIRYLTLTGAKVGRVACVLHRICDNTSPAGALSRHFCKERWIDGPLNRPSDFELHAHKRFRLDERFEVNSWVRFKTAVRQVEDAPNFPPNVIFVEQDLNTLAEEMDFREMSEPEIRAFFEVAPREMHHILDLYLPTEQV